MVRVYSDDKGFLLFSILNYPERGLNGRGSMEKLRRPHLLDWTYWLLFLRGILLRLA